MIYNDEARIKAMKELREYIEEKYGTFYISAIAKLNASNQYDEKGFLKPELVLTSQERDALMFYVPETSKFLEKINPVAENQTQNQSLEERYQTFLNDVSKRTIESASKQTLPANPNAIIPWEAVGVEFNDLEIIKQYGKDVYKKAFEEVPYEKIPHPDGNGFYRMYHRNFAKANIKLGHLIHEGVAASPLLDLDLFIEKLNEKGIPSYIDYETNTFYYNGVPTIGKTK